MKSETKEKILNAAVELFAAKGYKSTTTLAIAYKSGVDETTIYKHFKNKKSLFQEAFLVMTPDKSLVPTKRLTNGKNLKEDLKLFIRNYMILHINHIPAYRISMLLDEVYDKEIYANSFKRIEGMIEQFEMYLVKLNEQGKIRDSDYKALTEFLFSLFLTKANEFIISAVRNYPYNKKLVNEFAETYAEYFSSLLNINQ
jgi:TetR/AcrR family transcriptional repressor of mexJK operon